MKKEEPVVVVKEVHITINVTTVKGIVGLLKSFIPKTKQKEKANNG